MRFICFRLESVCVRVCVFAVDAVHLLSFGSYVCVCVSLCQWSGITIVFSASYARNWIVAFGMPLQDNAHARTHADKQTERVPSK